jgi:hypothetical protein
MTDGRLLKARTNHPVVLEDSRTMLIEDLVITISNRSDD